MATLAVNAIGRLAEESTSLKVNADHWGDKAKHSLFSKQQHITIERLHSQRTLRCNRVNAKKRFDKHCQEVSEINFFSSGATFAPWN